MTAGPWRRAALVGIVVAAALAGYGQLLSPHRVVASPYSDVFACHFAAKASLRHALASGGSLLWREDRLAGQPGLTHPQSSWGNPLHALFWLLPPERAIGPTLFALFLLTAAGCAALAAAFGLGWEARALAALAGLFQAKSVLVAYAGWLGVLPSLALLPWFFWALKRALERPGLRSTMALGLVAALLLHCGHLQLPYYAALAAVGWTLAHLIARRGHDGRRIALTLTGSLVWSLAAAAWLLVPLALESPLLTRVHADWRFLLGGHVLTPRLLLTLLRPEILGTPHDRNYPRWTLWEDEAYFGLVPLAGAIVALALTPKRPWVRVLAGGFVLTVLMTFDTPLLRCAYLGLPGFRLFRVPTRLLFLTSLFGVQLGAFGLDALVARVAPRTRLALTALALLLVAGEGIYLARRYLPTEPIETALPPSAVVDRIAAEPGRFRVALVGFPEQMAWPVRPAPQLLQLGGYDSYTFAHYQDYFERMRTGAPAAVPSPRSWTELDRVARWDLIDALAVRFVVAPASVELPRDHFDAIGTFEHEPCFLLFDGIAHARVRLWRNRLAGPFSEVWHPGWRATVDGVPAPIERSQGALLRVVAPPGSHEVTLCFRPLGWPAAPIVSLAALALLVAGLGWQRFRRAKVTAARTEDRLFDPSAD
jgi:hypothetical protein